jgi:formylglycine-generating enzyme required for sulfatase activity
MRKTALRPLLLALACTFPGCHQARPATVAAETQPASGADATAPAPVAAAVPAAGLRCPVGMALIPTGPTPGGFSPSVTPRFCIDTLETTVAEYRECLRARACAKPSHPLSSKRPRQPIDCVGFGDAGAYCRFRGKRLPAPNEWARAAGGDSGTYHPWGNDVNRSPGPVCWQKREPCDVGTNAGDVSVFGVRDMAGNVSEWTADPANEGRRPGEWHSEEILGGDWESTLDGPIGPLGSITGRPRGSIEGACAGVRCAWPLREGTR